MQRADPGLAPCAREPRPRGQVGPGADREGRRLILGCVIAGGRASRFGSDKALALWDGERLIDRARATLAPYCAAVVVAGGERAGIDALADVPAPGLGPLGGIAAALAHAEAEGFASVLTIGCDMPEVPADLLGALAVQVGSYCPEAPVLGHWPAAAAGPILTYLTNWTPAKGTHRSITSMGSKAGVQTGLPPSREHNKSLSVRRWAETSGVTPIPAPLPLRNVNTPGDLLR